jgi:hypothetical protein
MGGCHPINLLNALYKILTKALAKRIRLLVNEIVHKEQTQFIKSRFIHNNLITPRRGLSGPESLAKRCFY